MPVYLNIIQQISSYLEKKNEEPESAKCEDNSLEESLFLSHPSSQIKGTVKKIIQTKVEEDPENTMQATEFPEVTMTLCRGKCFLMVIILFYHATLLIIFSKYVQNISHNDLYSIKY
ncbi:unnamed protein product [Meganyctiphanes norvegica]|uniref:Uncharacterized protein n=1 Tax=Meganyctiphanes norvegica TaxID=48144 RepID=A0AAV2Q7Y7_MEGNR